MKLFPKFRLVESCLPYVPEQAWIDNARHYNMSLEQFRKFASMNKVTGLSDWQTGYIYIDRGGSRFQKILIGIHEIAHYYVGLKYGMNNHWHNKIEKYLSFKWAFPARRMPE